jgi:acetylglutamate kinase
MSPATTPVVVKLGGTTLADQEATLREVAERSRHDPLVLVHGGGKRLTAWLGRMGVESRFEGGLRVTDDAALEVALGVLRGVINAELVASLRAMGADAVGWSGVDGGTLTGGRLPVIAPAALDPDGIICNVNADDAAAAIAGALGGRLLLLTDTDGVWGADRQRIPSLTVAESEQLIASGVIEGGMVPKVRCAERAMRSGAAQAVIADGGAPYALARALDDPSFGTRWTA